MDREKGVVSCSWKELVSYEPSPGSEKPHILFSDKNMAALQFEAEWERAHAELEE